MRRASLPDRFLPTCQVGVVRTICALPGVLGLLCGLALSLAVIPHAQAQAPSGAPGSIPADSLMADQLSDQAVISLLTIYPGSEIYAEFGHSAIRVRDPERGIDRTYDYGTFAFNEPGFVPKFVYGQLDYFLSTRPYSRSVAHFRRMGRPMVEQTLNLDAAQAEALYQFLEYNARPENRYYRYDFLFDNCSTRIRDAFKSTLGEAVQFAPLPNPEQSFRHLLDPWVADRPLVDVGFDLALGMPTERTASPWETMFLPLYLKDAFDHAVVVDGDRVQPLVARTDTVFWTDNYDPVQAEWKWPQWLLWSLLAVGLLVTLRQLRAGQALRRWPDVLLLGVAGLAGLLIAFLWFVSEHAVTDANWNLAWAWPTHLIVAVLLAVQRPTRRWVRYYLATAASVNMVLVLGWVLLPQDLHPALLPLLILMAARWSGHALSSSGKISSAPERTMRQPLPTP